MDLNKKPTQQITKVEVLWTYLCPLSCSYCNMKVKGGVNTRSREDWASGIDNWKKLGAEFVAIYGAEPLAQFNNLPEFVRDLSDSGIESTIITSGYVSEFFNKLQILHENGLRSLTMSYDIVPYDESSRTKSDIALESLLFFQKFKNVRDTAAVVTITSDNIERLCDTIKKLSECGIYTFCDLAHWDRGNIGTKCKGEQGSIHLTDLRKFIRVFKEVMELRDLGYLVHFNEPVFQAVINNALEYTWNCAENHAFPSWITVDPHGVVFPCDDFRPEYIGNAYDMTNIADEWSEFSEYWKGIIRTKCNGCLWCTHIQSHAIKNGLMSIKDYVHGK